MEEITPLCLLVAITSIDTAGNLAGPVWAQKWGQLEFLYPAALGICPVPSGGTKMDSARVFTQLAGGPFLTRSSRAGCLPSPLWHRGEPVWESWKPGMVWLEGLFKGITLVGVACPLSSLQLGKKVPFLPGIVIVACSAINIHWEALLIVFLINSMPGTLGVPEECALVGTFSRGKFILPWQIYSWA